MRSTTASLALLAFCLLQSTVAADLLGFNNRSCSAGTATRPAGPGVGPSLRAATAANAWTTFTVTVTKELPGGAMEAVLSTFAAPGGPQPRCMGNLVAEKAAACADHRAHIHPAAQAGAGVPWALTPVGNGAHTISHSGRADGCATHLTASAACGSAAPFLAPADGSPLQEWRLEPVNPAPIASPPPPPPPLAGQPPSLTISSIEATSVLATIAPPPGGCTPIAYVVSHARALTLDAPARTAVPAGAGALTARLGNLAAGVEYEATAVGTCADGTKTPASTPVRFTPVPTVPSDVAWVVNRDGGTVSACTVSGTKLIDCADSSATFVRPNGIAIVGSTAWVTNNNGDTVSACTVSGTKLIDCVDSGAPINDPLSIVIAGSTAWVTSWDSDPLVYGCTVSGTKLVDCASTGIAGTGIAGTAVNSATVWVANTNGQSISACTVSGNTLNCADSGASGFSPYDIAIAGSTAWVTAPSGPNVYACAISGSNQLACLDSGATFDSPEGIAIVGSTAWVTNWLADTIDVCTISGTKLIDCADSGGTDFHQPVDIAFSVA